MPLPRVVVVDHTGQLGGGEVALLRALTRLHGTRADVRAILLAPGPFLHRLREAGIPTAVVPLAADVNTTSRNALLRPGALFRSLVSTVSLVPRLVRAIRGARAELVVANTLKAAIFVALAAPLAGRRWVWHLHDRLAPDYLPSILVRAMRMLAVIGPRAIVVNSRATLATLPARAQRKARIAYPGLDMSDAASATPPAGEPVVGIIGRMSPTKGQREFLRAAAQIASDFPKARFRIIGGALFGEDDYEAKMRALPLRLGIADRVEFTGWVDDPEEQLRALTVLVHASPVPEPFGQVIVEAMAAGVPVVATAAGGVLEILDPGGTQSDVNQTVNVTRLGVLARPGAVRALAEAIRRALADPEATAQRAAAARSVASARFGIASTVDAIQAAWDDARLGRGRRRD